jgi:hypothetical protein
MKIYEKYLLLLLLLFFYFLFNKLCELSQSEDIGKPIISVISSNL